MVSTGAYPRPVGMVAIVRWRTFKSSQQAMFCLAPDNGDDQGELWGFSRWCMFDISE
jgi:hypothetical protein